jgi:F-type H+-transporting ATPase subunit epsilon
MADSPAAGTLRLEVATPERMLIGEDVREVTVPGATGELGILPGHAALLGELGAGQLAYSLTSGQRHSVVVCGGWVEVHNDHVRVLASSAERANEIDVARAEAAFKRASERLNQVGEGNIDIARALNAMKRAQARLAAANAARSSH